MKHFFKHLLIAGAMLTAAAAQADDKGHLFIIGDATPGGWDLDMAQALMASAENPAVYNGTIYLKGGEANTFKFMQNHEWGSTEYGIPAEAAVAGEFELATGTLDDGYSKIHVAQDGNYRISIDTENLKGDISLSEYQATEIKYCALYMVGDATEGNWSIDDGTPLYQSATAPYEYSDTVALKASGSFKIFNALRGAGSWDAKYFYYKDANDEGKISNDSTDDRQWKVAEDGDYVVTVNTVEGTISITKPEATPDEGGDEGEGGETDGIDTVVASESSAVYYNLQGCKVANPASGVFIKVVGNKATKVTIR